MLYGLSLAIAVCCCGVLSTYLPGDLTEDLKKTQMVQDLEIIKHHFDVGYAPKEWKETSIGWSLDESCEQAKDQILNTRNINTKQFQQILRSFLQTTRDYHVQIKFISTESATLPFIVRGAASRYFIRWVDNDLFPDIEVGDELLEFDGRPIAEVIAELKKHCGRMSNALTDQALAEIALTDRQGSSGDMVPKGAITIKILPKQPSNPLLNIPKIQTHQFMWSHNAEYIADFADYNFNPHDTITSSNLKNHHDSFDRQDQNKITIAPINHGLVEDSMINRKCASKGYDGELGARKGFLPKLGTVLWTNTKNRTLPKKMNKYSSALPTISWHAYIYDHPTIGPVGYIRIPHYSINSEDVKEFGKIVSYMEGNTHALVIDQTNNFGGFLNFQYEIASILATTPLLTPHHQIKLTQKEVYRAYRVLEHIKYLEYFVNQEWDNNEHEFNEEEEDDDDDDDDDENEEKQSADLAESYRHMLFSKNYSELILEDWNAGRSLTRPTPILGIDMIHPHSKYHYRKPKVLLINEMCFSGADIMAATLKDSREDGNLETLLFGTCTAGAGGFVEKFEFPNIHGIVYCSYTASIAERINSIKIENVGVTPDIEYRVTVEDLQNNYEGYVEAINKTLEYLLQVN